MLPLETENLIKTNIEEHGFHIGMIEGDKYLPSYAFSIGLYKSFQHPEIIVFGLPNEVMQNLLTNVCQAIKDGRKYEANVINTEVINNFPVQFIDVDQAYYSDYLEYISWFYNQKNDFKAYQMVWTDKGGFFPWESSFNNQWKFNQPLLDRNTDFKFYEERSQSVYTTKNTLEGNPILWVYHTHEGDWEFHSEEHPDFDNAKVLSFDEIIKLDPSLNQLFQLNYGQSAIRKSVDDDWEISDYEEEE
ncbi:DUF4262 domain-containing protein [Flammeovirga yaeyamensis]|uniref:DUF4262 domain-containing protein n=1 Tax=Flammeovirga yaeyamensis TaxID=367791 RepID=A0AAX1N8T5_9BACT|nr:DUF4262 domain-containing protein [Flammeovirga yaeyamensis]MBB3698700.1 hypothetical protein [Flammeovirga yaeyamensis]NMF37287.1 DUF4262 domain-containing protein [Flammeovirga yaeyamensis]QWG03895.1 DUF4262 domain-containing protein [Flammeovirga yaeyamensis]